MLKFLVLFAALVCLGYCDHIDLDAYPFNSVLRADNDGSPLYTLYWNFSTAEETITFAVKAKTNGWVGFGVSPNGGMVNSDVVIGWVNAEGQAFLQDRYAFEQSRPPVDPQQDWTLIRGENENGFTTLEFWRKLVTCDERDRDIEANTARVIFSWNENDPTNDDPETPVYHGVNNRGSASLNLLGGLIDMPPELPTGSIGSFNITVDNIVIPSGDTTYWCAAFELPQEIQSQKRYIIRYSPVISPNEFQYVHHLLVYLCDSLEATDVGASAPCGGAVGSSVSQCLSGELIAAWAVGGNDFIYPQNVAYPIGGASGQRYLVMQVHYDNPMRDSNMRDSSGIEFFYENAPRQFDAGILLMGHEVNQLMIIPPQATNYGVTGVCSSECTSRYLPEGGIKIFANLLHTHLVGRGLTMRILRPTQQCGGLEELKPVDQNLQYDFNYQQFTYLPEEITVYPGDVLLLDCNYTTTGNDGVVLGGESTREEMCFSFPVYYPRAPLSSCVSNPVMDAFVPFAQEYVPDQTTLQAIIQALQTSPSAFQSALDQNINWTPEAAAALEKSIRSGPIEAGCTTDQPGVVFSREQDIPVPRCSYIAPDVCASSMPAKAFGLAASVVSIAVGLAALMLL